MPLAESQGLTPKLFPKQLDFYNEVVTNRRSHKFIFAGGAQSGKTRVVSWIAVGKIGEKMTRTAQGDEPGTAWLVAPTFKLLRKLKREFLAKLPLAWIARQNKDEVLLVTGDRVQFMSADNPQDLRSEDCFIVVFDELSRASEDAFLNVQTRLAVHDGLFVASTTPCNAESPWLTDEYFGHTEDPEYSWGHASIEDNLSIPRHRIAELRRRFPDEYGTEELDGRFLRSKEGLVYKNFDGRKHIIDSFTPGKDDIIVAGGDQGLNHPFTYLRAALHPGGGMTVFSALGLTQTAPSDQVAAVLADSSGRGDIERRVLRRWFDPSGSLTRAEFHKNGLATRLAKNKVDEGIRSVYALLSAPGMFRVTRDCEGLIKEFGLYRFKRDTGGKKGDVPVKLHDDFCFAAGTLISTPSGMVPIEKVVVGDRVFSHLGVATVEVSAQVTGVKSVSRLHLSNGTDMLCTEGHPFLMEDGTWKTVALIKAGDRLQSRSSTTRGFDSIWGPLDTTNPRALTIRETRISGSCTKSCGTKSVEEESLRNTFTTRMGFAPTTESRILNSSQVQTTSGTTSKKNRGNTLSGLQRQPNGTVLPKGASGTACTPKKSGKRWNRSNVFVNGANQSSRPSSRETERDSVALPTSTMPGSSPASMTKIAPAFSVESRIAAIATRRRAPVAVPVRLVTVGQIERNVAEVPVYNLATGDGTYVAGGVIVSNCDALRYIAYSENLAPGIEVSTEDSVVRAAAKKDVSTSSACWDKDRHALVCKVRIPPYMREEKKQTVASSWLN